MRVTDQMIFQRAAIDVASQRSNLFALQTKSATGKKFQAIEESPVEAQRVRMLREAKQAQLHYKTNIDRSRTQLETADTALEEATNILIRAKEIAVAMGNEITSPEERAIMAREVDSLFESMVNVANTSAGGEHIFGGYQVDSPPFLSDGTFVGDANVKEIDAGPSVRLPVSVSGAQAFTAAGGVDVFASLQALSTALAADDDTGIQAAIDTMDQCLDQVTRARSDAGLKLNRLDVAEAVRQTLEDSLTKEESSVIDIDPVDTFMQLNETARALQQALAVSQKVTADSLLNHL